MNEKENQELEGSRGIALIHYYPPVFCYKLLTEHLK